MRIAHLRCPLAFLDFSPVRCGNWETGEMFSAKTPVRYTAAKTGNPFSAPKGTVKGLPVFVYLIL